MRVTASYPLRACRAIAGVRSWSGLVTNRLGLFVRVVVVLAIVPALTLGLSLGEQSSAAPPATNQVEQVTSQELRRLFLQLQEQFQATQLAIEQNRQETKAAAAQNAEALANGLQTIQEVLAGQRARDWAAMQSSNELVLVVAGTFAAISLLTMLIMTYFQWRMSKGLAEISIALPAVLGLGAGSAAAGLSPAESATLHLPGFEPQADKGHHPPKAGPQPAQKHSHGLGLPLGSRLFVDAGAVLRRQRVRALRTVVIVCLICAAALALLLYLVTCGKLSLGPLHAVLKI